jgi:hypothetical protein
MSEIIKFNKDEFNPHNNSLTKLVDKSLAGFVDQLDAYIFLKKIETTVKNSLALLQDGATDEAMRHGKGEHLVKGTYINVKASAGRWVFSDRVTKAKAEVKRLQEQEKSAFKGGAIIVDAETGEEISPANYFQGKEIVSIKVPKV